MTLCNNLIDYLRVASYRVRHILLFTSRCTIVQSAVEAIACRPSVRLSVCPSVTLVDQDHIRWKSSKLIARTISATPSLLGGWGKLACWRTKAAIFLKRVKIEEKLLWRAYRNSSTLFGTMHASPTPYDLLFPKTGGSQPPPKTSIAIISGTGKAVNFKFCSHIHRIDPNKSR